MLRIRDSACSQVLGTRTALCQSNNKRYCFCYCILPSLCFPFSFWSFRDHLPKVITAVELVCIDAQHSKQWQSSAWEMFRHRRVQCHDMRVGNLSVSRPSRFVILAHSVNASPTIICDVARGRLYIVSLSICLASETNQPWDLCLLDTVFSS